MPPDATTIDATPFATLPPRRRCYADATAAVADAALMLLILPLDFD